MVTIDTNIAVYTIAADPKRMRAQEVLESCDFLSVQVLNEFALATRRKLKKSWQEIADASAAICGAVDDVRSIDLAAHQQALRLNRRYQVNFCDGLMIAVALANGATTMFSEDMQHGLVIDGTLRIENPFL